MAHSFKLPGGKPAAANQRDDWLGGSAQAMHYCVQLLSPLSTSRDDQLAQYCDPRPPLVERSGRICPTAQSCAARESRNASPRRFLTRDLWLARLRDQRMAAPHLNSSAAGDG